jgi:hypothetical protein
VDKRSGDITFARHGRPGKHNFGETAESFISRLPILDTSKYPYRNVYRKHVRPVFGDRQQARHVIVGTVEEAVKAGKLSKHRLDGIDLADSGRYSRKSFVFPTDGQVRFVADGGTNRETRRAVGGAGLCVWLMRGCGLRIDEALTVSKGPSSLGAGGCSSGTARSTSDSCTLPRQPISRTGSLRTRRATPALPRYAGVDITVIALWLGHESLATTR